MEGVKEKMNQEGKKISAFDSSLFEGAFKNATPEEIKHAREIMANVNKMIKNGDMKGALKYLETKRNEFRSCNR